MQNENISKRQKLQTFEFVDTNKMGAFTGKQVENSKTEFKTTHLSSRHFEEAIQKAKKQCEYLKILLELRENYFPMIIGIYYKILLKSKIERTNSKTKSCLSLIKTMVKLIYY